MMQKRVILPGCCFLADTIVKLPEGQVKISDIKVGSRVVSYDLERRRFVEGKVVRVDVEIEPVILDIRFAKSDVLTCTPSQRLWAGSAWMCAGEVLGGVTVGEATCASVIQRPWGKSVFTLVVEPWNNYVVLSLKGERFVAHDNSSDVGYPPGFQMQQAEVEREHS